MDNTLNKFWIPFVEQLSNIKNKEYTLELKDFKSYQIIHNFKEFKDDEWFPLTNQIFNIPNFWLDMPVQDGAIEVVKRLQKDSLSNVYIVTAPWVYYKDCIKEKMLWIEKYFPFIHLDQMIFMKDKFLLRKGILIDDAPKYLSSFKGTTITLDYPYSRHIDVSCRATDWFEIGRYLGVL